MSILGAVIVPHPPLIIPAVGHGREQGFQITKKTAKSRGVLSTDRTPLGPPTPTPTPPPPPPQPLQLRCPGVNLICETGQLLYQRHLIRTGTAGTQLRRACDEAETVTAKKYWPFPNYGEWSYSSCPA